MKWIESLGQALVLFTALYLLLWALTIIFEPEKPQYDYRKTQISAPSL